MTGKVSDNVRCGKCQLFYPRDEKKEGTTHCPKCRKAYKTAWDLREKVAPVSETKRFCTTWGDAGLYN